MSKVHSSLRQSRCLAEQPVHLVAAAAAEHTWQLHVSTVQLFISGPGDDAWHACSEPCYYGQVGTDHERHIAQQAVTILRQNHGQDKEAGKK